jgi:hypothetical protein
MIENLTLREDVALRLLVNIVGIDVTHNSVALSLCFELADEFLGVAAAGRCYSATGRPPM